MDRWDGFALGVSADQHARRHLHHLRSQISIHLRDAFFLARVSCRIGRLQEMRLPGRLELAAKQWELT